MAAFCDPVEMLPLLPPSVFAVAALCIAEGPGWGATEVTPSLTRKESRDRNIAMVMFSK